MSKYPMHRHTPRKKIQVKPWTRPWLTRWHWRLGLVFVPLVCWLLITGVLLQYAERLSLDDEPVRSETLLNYYGIPKPQAKHFSIDHRWISAVEQDWYLDHHLLEKNLSALQNVFKLNDMLVAVGRHHIVLLDSNGSLIEVLNAASLPGAIDRATLVDDRLMVETALGQFVADESLLNWQAMDAIEWPMVQAKSSMPELLIQAITLDWRARQLNWERVLQDLHSGRLFGIVGEILSDLAALGLLFLSFSGVWMWWKRRNGGPRQ